MVAISDLKPDCDPWYHVKDYILFKWSSQGVDAHHHWTSFKSHERIQIEEFWASTMLGEFGVTLQKAANFSYSELAIGNINSEISQFLSQLIDIDHNYSMIYSVLIEL